MKEKRTIRQKLSGYLEEDGLHLRYYGHWDSKGQPRFFTSEEGKVSNFNVRRYLWEEATGTKLGNKRLMKRCSEYHCVNPECHEVRVSPRSIRNAIKKIAINTITSIKEPKS